MPTPFDFIKDLSYEKKDLLNQDFDANNKDYNQWMINKGFSYFADTILHAAELNTFHNMSNHEHNKYLLEAVRRRKRFAKWAKPQKDENLELIQAYYKCGKREAQDYVKILSIKEIEAIKEKMNPGGDKRKR